MRICYKILTHNETDSLEKLLDFLFENIKERNLSVVPTCPAIAIFIRKNKQYRGLLPVGIKI